MHQTGDIVQVFADNAFAAQRHQHQERTQVHERVDHHIHGDAFDAGGVPGNQTEQHVTSVRNGTICEQALDVALIDGGQVADCHGGDGYKA